jgi:hypothetical protein
MAKKKEEEKKDEKKDDHAHPPEKKKSWAWVGFIPLAIFLTCLAVAAGAEALQPHMRTIEWMKEQFLMLVIIGGIFALAGVYAKIELDKANKAH